MAYTNAHLLGRQAAYQASVNENGLLEVLQGHQQNYGIGIQLPFQPNDQNPLGINLAYSTAQAIQADIINVLLTHKGERPMNPSFGSNIHQFLFEENTPELAQQIEESIRDTIKEYTITHGTNNGFGVEINEINVERHDAKGNVDNRILVQIKYTVAGDIQDIIEFVMGGGSGGTDGPGSPFSSHLTQASQLSNMGQPLNFGTDASGDLVDEPQWIDDNTNFDTL